MAYTKRTWIDGKAGNTPINANALNNIENGIAALDAALPHQNFAASAGQWVVPVGQGAVGTNNALGSGNLRVFPVVIRKETRIDGLSVSVTAAGTAGALVRLAIYADNGSGYPGAKVVDAGTVAGDAIANPIASFTAVTLQPGIYWFGAVLQGTLTTQPTLVIASSMTPEIPIRVGSSPIATAALGYRNSGVSGAVPANFTNTPTANDLAPRILYRAA